MNTTTKAAHTPTPVEKLKSWRNGGVPSVDYCAGNQEFANDVSALLDSHDALVRALEEWRAFHDLPLSKTEFSQLAAIVEQTDAALAQAKP